MGGEILGRVSDVGDMGDVSDGSDWSDDSGSVAEEEEILVEILNENPLKGRDISPSYSPERDMIDRRVWESSLKLEDYVRPQYSWEGIKKIESKRDPRNIL